VYYSKEMALNISLNGSFNNIQEWEGIQEKAGKFTVQKLI
jgi:hypothetical protein